MPRHREALIVPYRRRTAANFVALIERVEGRPSPEAAHLFAALDNLSMLRAADVPLYSAAHPHGAFVLQPVYAAYLNPIERWCRVPRSLALNGRRFESWVEVSAAAAGAGR